MNLLDIVGNCADCWDMARELRGPRLLVRMLTIEGIVTMSIYQLIGVCCLISEASLVAYMLVSGIIRGSILDNDV